jgi:CelD/BcsL family acetyltransferase involved in cellulose biosynthesis
MNQETKQVGYHFETVWRNGHAGCRHVPLVNRLCRKRTGRTGQLDVACITTLEGLHALRECMATARTGRRPQHTAFQSYDWCAAWADAFVPSSAKIELCIVTLQHLGEPVCILPGMICIENGPRIFRALSQPYAQYSDILCHPNWRTPQCSMQTP